MQLHTRFVARGGLILLAGAAFAITACSDNNNSAPLVASAIVAISGTTGQSGTAGTALTQSVGVHVTDQSGNPVPNAVVSWAVTAGAGSVASTTSETDASGDATMAWTLGDIAGVDSVTASLAAGASVVIGAVATAGPVASLVKVSGDAQTITSGSTSLPMVVRAIDLYGNIVVNVSVAWSVQGGGTLSSGSTTTDVNGLSQVTLQTASLPASYAITAASGVAATATFTLTGN